MAFIRSIMKSKLNSISYITIVVASFTSILSILFIRKIIENFKSSETDFFFISIFTMLIILMMLLLQKITIIVISESDGVMKCQGILFPFGKTLYFNNYKGIYKTTETGSIGTYEVIYLVDHNDITRFKIMGVYYKNMDEIIAAIPLPVIKRNLSGKEYLKLMFTGRANLSKIKDKKNTDSKIAFYFKVFSAVTILIFVIGMLVRILSW